MLCNLLCMRRVRSSLTKDEYQSDNAKARDGMIEGRKPGFLMPLQVRSWRDVHDMDLWRAFAKLGTPNMIGR